MTKKSYHKYIVCMDLEMNQPSGRIIELGAVVGDTETGEVVDSLRCLVNPGEPISPYITELTGISDSDVAGGMGVVDAYEALVAMCSKWGACRTLYTWGGGDSAELKKQIESDNPSYFQNKKSSQVDSDEKNDHDKGDLDKVYESDKSEAPNDAEKNNYFFFGHRWEDMKTVYKMWGLANDVVGKAGLAKALTRLGLEFDGTPHRALDDALNTFKVFMFFKNLMIDTKARPGTGRRPHNLDEQREKKRREKLVATGLSISGLDLDLASEALGERPISEVGDHKSFNLLLSWSEKALKFLREKRREERSRAKKEE